VSRDGATLLTAFDINQAYTASRDAHVTAPVEFTNGGAALVKFAIIDLEGVPGQYLSLTETDGKVSVVLKSVSKGDNGRDVVSIVKTIEQIDGRDALEYLQWFVDLPGNTVSDCGQFKSPGSRMQFLLRRAGNDGLVVAGTIQLGNVFDDLPDSVPITYSDGSIGFWHYTVFPDGWEDYTEAEMTQAANTIPEDGPYAIFEAALDQATASVSEKRKRESAVLSAVPDFPKAKTADRGQKRASVVYSRPEQDGEMVYTNITISGVGDRDQVFYITHIGNATVLRFTSFEMSRDFEKLVEVYNYIFDYGKKHSTLQLVIDLTDNGGKCRASLLDDPVAVPSSDVPSAVASLSGSIVSGGSAISEVAEGCPGSLQLHYGIGNGCQKRIADSQVGYFRYGGDAEKDEECAQSKNLAVY